ncbi:bifunctional serine/threonine-protein kinase/ABC transporter substrate-binding protein [Streptomyces sp. NPDC058745]|uniref:bifunctional serine/threonine-protein kinase/ABC transporter substrate-binding protein n=1 Tax=Streptomyces sp. NPDC058745 TaxID=3346621 RepID=UPI0036C030EA
MTEHNSELIAGRYQLVERIGQGGMGRVWRGVDQQLFGREVAIKEIVFPLGLDDGDRATLLRRFTGEARAAVTLSHPGIITIHDVVEHRGAPVIVMEYIRGQSLAAAIRGEGRLPVRRVAEIGSAVLDALAEAHAARIVHRDIKPDNVLVTKDRVVLTDFGIAHLADATTKLSHSGIVIGTPQYMPPEQLEGKRPTPANDLWALGATLYHAVEGQPPFEAEGLHALAVAILTRPHRPPTRAGGLAPVLDALLAKDPADRPGAAEAAELLASALSSTSSSSSSLSSSSPRSRVDAGAEPEPEPDSGSVPAPQPTPASLPDAATDDARPEMDGEAEPASSPPSPHSLPTPTVADSVPTVDAPRRPVPDRPPTPPVPPAEDTVRLGGNDRDGRDEEPAVRRRALTRRSSILAAALATLAVGSVLTWTLNHDDQRGGGDDAGGNGSGATPVTVVIGVDAPLSGGLASFGVGIKNSADLAARTANRTGHVPGVKFTIEALDDEATPAKGRLNAARFVADKQVLGIVGPLNSGVAQEMQEPLAQAGLVNVSPANTNPMLTLGPDWAQGTKARPHPTYFRTVATDVDQGPVAARYLHGEAGKRKLYVVDDNSSYGTTLTSGFTAEITRLGGTVVGAGHVTTQQGDFTEITSKIRASGADAVYFGGDYLTAGPLSQQLKQAGARIPLMGGDGIFDQQFLTTNTQAEGDLATNIGVPAENLTGGGTFLTSYRDAGYPETAGPYGPYAYDATWAVIEAVKAVVKANGGTLPENARAKMPQAVAGLGFDGVTGRVAFDAYGDTLNRGLTVYAVKDGKWTTVTTASGAP